MTSITYTATLDVGRQTAESLARLLREHRERLGTRKGPRAQGVFKQGVLVLRWFVDGTRLAQLARDNRVSVPTAYRCLQEGLTVLADHAPDLSTALERAAARRLHPSQPGRHRHPYRPRHRPRPQRRRPLVVREAQAPRRQRPGHLRPRRLADLGLPGPPRPTCGHGRRATPAPPLRGAPEALPASTARSRSL